MKNITVKGTYTKKIECPFEFSISENDKENWSSYVEQNLKYMTLSDYGMNGSYGIWNAENFQDYIIDNSEDVQFLIAKEFYICKNGIETRYTPHLERFNTSEEAELFFQSLFD